MAGGDRLSFQSDALQLRTVDVLIDTRGHWDWPVNYRVHIEMKKPTRDTII